MDRNPFTGDKTESGDFYNYYLHPLELTQGQIVKYDCQFRKLFPIPNTGKIVGNSLKDILKMVKKNKVNELNKINPILKEIQTNIINGEAPGFWQSKSNQDSFRVEAKRDEDARKLIVTILMTES